MTDTTETVADAVESSAPIKRRKINFDQVRAKGDRQEAWQLSQSRLRFQYVLQNQMSFSCWSRPDIRWLWIFDSKGGAGKIFGLWGHHWRHRFWNHIKRNDLHMPVIDIHLYMVRCQMSRKLTSGISRPTQLDVQKMIGFVVKQTGRITIRFRLRRQGYAQIHHGPKCPLKMFWKWLLFIVIAQTIRFWSD